LARRLRGAVGLFKVGSQLFTAEGPRAVEKLAGLGFGIFLDLKFHDIPNTVAGAVAAAAGLPKVRLLTVHTLGGVAMMRAAREAAARKKNRPAVLGVTILTCHDAATLRSVGISGTPRSRALALARLAKEAGLDGVVASAHEARAIRRACGRNRGSRSAAGERGGERSVSRGNADRGDSRRSRLPRRWETHHRGAESPRGGAGHRRGNRVGNTALAIA
jgi:orotidine-5'-phosphate decarboxylase